MRRRRYGRSTGVEDLESVELGAYFGSFKCYLGDI